MITFRLIREDLNAISEISQFELSNGEDVTLKLQMLTSYDNQPYYLVGTETIIVELPSGLITPVTKTPTIDSTNKSIISVSLSDTETANIISGHIKVTITAGTITRIAKRENILRRNV